jgi:predicted nucleotidyltransferase
MRLKQWEIQIIKSTVREVMGETAKVWLFGSRVDESQYGGDIDLLVATDLDNPKELALKKSLLWAKLQLGLGEQRIDIILEKTEKQQTIEKIAKKNGICL